jgi:hypothetical protein
VAAFYGTDPLRMGSMVDLSEMPPHTDARECLCGAEVQGSESVAFDPRGRGTYTGVADGRVVFWDGERWAPFTTTSPR